MLEATVARPGDSGSARVCQPSAGGVSNRPAGGTHDDGGVVGHARTLPPLNEPVTGAPISGEAGGKAPGTSRARRFESGASSTIIASTASGAHFLRTYMPVCMVPKCGAAGTVELVSRLDNSARVFCLDHGLDRLDALDYGKRGAA